MKPPPDDPAVWLVVEIARFVDAHQPGFVECRLVDADGVQHAFIEKVPVVSTDDRAEASAYPCPGALACEVQERWRDASGRDLVRICTERPWGVESTTGPLHFVVLASQLRS